MTMNDLNRRDLQAIKWGLFALLLPLILPLGIISRLCIFVDEAIGEVFELFNRLRLALQEAWLRRFPTK
jgi:hypothetical protein